MCSLTNQELHFVVSQCTFQTTWLRRTEDTRNQSFQVRILVTTPHDPLQRVISPDGASMSSTAHLKIGRRENASDDAKVIPKDDGAQTCNGVLLAPEQYGKKAA